MVGINGMVVEHLSSSRMEGTPELANESEDLDAYERQTWDLSATSWDGSIRQEIIKDTLPLLAEACFLLQAACEETGRATEEDRLSRGAVQGLLNQMAQQKLNAGRMRTLIVIVGRSGTGKSTLKNILCRATRLEDEDLDKYMKDFLDKLIESGGDWEEVTLRDAEPYESVRLDTVTHANTGDRVEVYFPKDDKWLEGQVVAVENEKHEILFSGAEKPTLLSLQDSEVPDGAHGEAVWARRVWDLTFKQKGPRNESPDESQKPQRTATDLSSYYLLPEGSMGDTTRVECVLTAGPLVRMSFRYEPIGNVAQPILRLKQKWQDTCRFPAQSSGTLVNATVGDGEGQQAIGNELLDEDWEETEEEAPLVRDPREQTALAFMGKPPNTQITSLVEDDFSLPEEWREKLSSTGKVESFAPCQSMVPEEFAGESTLFDEHIRRCRYMLQTWAAGNFSRLIRDVRIELPNLPMKYHDFKDLPGLSYDSGLFASDTLAEMRAADIVLVTVDSRREQNVTIRPLVGLLYHCKRLQGSAHNRQKEKRFAVLCAGEKCFAESEGGDAHYTALVPGHPDNTEEGQKILHKLEKEWAADCQKAVTLALTLLISSREKLSEAVAEEAAKELASQVTYLVIYPRALYHPMEHGLVGQRVQYPPISEEDSHMLELRDFLRHEEASGGTIDSALEPVRKGEELLRKYGDLCALSFAFGRALRGSESQEHLKSLIQEESESVLPDLPDNLLEEVNQGLKGELQLFVDACTPERFGEELAKTVGLSTDLYGQIGRERPSRFKGNLQKALDSGPVPGLLNHAAGFSTVTNDTVYLQDLMLAPLREHPSEGLYRILGIVPGCDPTLSAPQRLPFTLMVSDFLEGVLGALQAGAAKALERLGPVDPSAPALLNQLISRNFDAIVSRHLCGLGHLRFIEVEKRAAELATSTEIALRVGKILRSKQRKWGDDLPQGKKSKMQLVESQTRDLARFEAEEFAKLVVGRLRKALLDIRNDAKKLPSQLKVEDLASLVEPPRLAHRALLVRRARVLQGGLERVRLTEERLSTLAGSNQEDGEFKLERTWELGEALQLLEAFEEPGSKASEESWTAAMEGALEKVAAGAGAAAPRSVEEGLSFVQQLEELFGGLAFARECFGEAVRNRAGLVAQNEQLTMPEGYLRSEADLLKLLKAIKRCSRSAGEAPSLRPRKGSELLDIANKLNRRQLQRNPQVRITRASRAAKRVTGQPGTNPPSGNSAAEGGPQGLSLVIACAGVSAVGGAPSKPRKKRPANSMALRFGQLKRKRDEATAQQGGAGGTAANHSAQLSQPVTGQAAGSEPDPFRSNSAKAGANGSQGQPQSGAAEQECGPRRSADAPMEGTESRPLLDLNRKPPEAESAELDAPAPNGQAAVEGGPVGQTEVLRPQLDGGEERKDPPESGTQQMPPLVETGPSNPHVKVRSRTQWFEMHKRDVTGKLVFRQGRILEGPLPRTALTTRNSELTYRVKYVDGREEITALQGAKFTTGRPPPWARAAAELSARAQDIEGDQNGTGGDGKESTADRKGKAKIDDAGSSQVENGDTEARPRPWHEAEVGWYIALLGDEYSPDQQGFAAAWAKYAGTTAPALPPGVKKNGVFYEYTYRDEASGDVHVERKRSVAQLWYILGHGTPVCDDSPEAPPPPPKRGRPTRGAAAAAARTAGTSDEAGPSGHAAGGEGASSRGQKSGRAMRQVGAAASGGRGRKASVDGRDHDVGAGAGDTRAAQGRGRLTTEEMKEVCSWMKEEGWSTFLLPRKGGVLAGRKVDKYHRAPGPGSRMFNSYSKVYAYMQQTLAEEDGV